MSYSAFMVPLQESIWRAKQSECRSHPSTQKAIDILPPFLTKKSPVQSRSAFCILVLAQWSGQSRPSLNKYVCKLYIEESFLCFKFEMRYIEKDRLSLSSLTSVSNISLWQWGCVWEIRVEHWPCSRLQALQVLSRDAEKISVSPDPVPTWIAVTGSIWLVLQSYASGTLRLSDETDKKNERHLSMLTSQVETL